MPAPLVSRENGTIRFKDQSTQRKDNSSAKFVTNAKTTLIVLLLSLFGFVIIMYRYSIIQLQRETLHMILGAANLRVSFYDNKQIGFLFPTNLYHNSFEVANETTSNENNTENFMILFWSHIYRSESQHIEEYKKKDCQYNVVISTDRAAVELADIIVVHQSMMLEIPPKTRKVPWLIDFDHAPVGCPDVRRSLEMKNFKYFIGPSSIMDFVKPLYIPEPKKSLPLSNSWSNNKALAIFNSCKRKFIRLIRDAKQFYNIVMINNCERFSLLRNRDTSVNLHRMSNLLNTTKNIRFLILFAEECHDFPDRTLSLVLQYDIKVILFGNKHSVDNIPIKNRHKIIPGNSYDNLGKLLKLLHKHPRREKTPESLKDNGTSIICQIMERVMGDKDSFYNTAKYMHYGRK